MRLQFCIQKVMLARTGAVQAPFHAPTDVLLEVNCPRAPALAALLRTDIKAVESSSACC